MSTSEKGKSKAAEEMESDLEQRQERRLEHERAEREDLNVGAIQTGTYDIKYPGIHWGPSYRIRRKMAKPTQNPKNEENESGAKA
jgi:hypothetical protein